MSLTQFIIGWIIKFYKHFGRFHIIIYLYAPKLSISLSETGASPPRISSPPSSGVMLSIPELVIPTSDSPVGAEPPIGSAANVLVSRHLLQKSGQIFLLN